MRNYKSEIVYAHLLRRATSRFSAAARFCNVLTRVYVCVCVYVYVYVCAYTEYKIYENERNTVKGS